MLFRSVLGIKNIGKLIPGAEEQKPKDPVTENMAILNGKPVKAFIQQDHPAHIKVHMAAIQDPMIQQLVGQSPMAQQIQAAALAHINEHVAFEYRKQIEQQLGAALPNPEDELPPNTEFEISKLMAQAAEQLLQKNQGEAAQQQAQQQMQDPIIQMQMQELAIKQQDAQRKAAKDQADIALKQQQIQVERERIAAQQETAGAQMAIRASTDRHKAAQQQENDGFRLGVDVVKQNMAQTHQKGMAQREQPKKDNK